MTFWAKILKWWRSLPSVHWLSIEPGKLFPRKDTPRRTGEPTEVVLHESCVRSRKGTVRSLRRQGYSVEFIVCREGIITQHVADITKRRCQHAGGAHNKVSVAIELCNRYYGADATANELVIRARWAHRGQYIVPTKKQLEAVWQLVCHVDVIFDTDLLRFPGIRGGKFYWGRDEHAAKAPGVKAHHRWHHADALFAELYCICRFRGLEADEAFEWTLKAAQSKSRTTELPKDRHTEGE